MSESLKEKIEAEGAKVHAAFDRLEEEVETVLRNLAFRLKQSLHISSHEEVDGQSVAAAEALSNALSAARDAATGDVQVTPVAVEPAPVPAIPAPEATDSKPADGAEESTAAGGAKDAPGSSETKEGE